MSCILLDFQVTDKKVFEDSGVFPDRIVQGYSIRPPKMYKPTKQAVLCTRNFRGIVWSKGRLDYKELPNIH